jgi:hypothetical protein
LAGAGEQLTNPCDADLVDIPGLIRSLPGVVFFFVCAFRSGACGNGLYVGWRSYRLAGLIATIRITAASAASDRGRTQRD